MKPNAKTRQRWCVFLQVVSGVAACWSVLEIGLFFMSDEILELPVVSGITSIPMQELSVGARLVVTGILAVPVAFWILALYQMFMVGDSLRREQVFIRSNFVRLRRFGYLIGLNGLGQLLAAPLATAYFASSGTIDEPILGVSLEFSDSLDLFVAACFVVILASVFLEAVSIAEEQKEII